MCLYPKLILNKKYTITKKNKGVIPNMRDNRTKYVSIGCGKCIECMKRKSREWKVRLNEEVQSQYKAGGPPALFVTLTFAEGPLSSFRQQYNDIVEELKDNAIATRATRLFLERVRKATKRSPKHFLITELGHTGTERIHMHGIIWMPEAELKKHWQYGYIYVGQYVNEKSINYITKYITKLDTDHKWFTPKILCSPGLGSNFKNSQTAQYHKFTGETTNTLYNTKTGTKLPLPIYYRNQLYTEEQREDLWLNLLNKEKRYVCGEEVDVSTPEGENTYDQLVQYYRSRNKRLGYGTPEWNAKNYKKKLHEIKELTKKLKNNDKYH